MTDPWCCHIYCAMDPINIPSIYVSINIPAPAGSVMGHIIVLSSMIYSYQRLPVLYTTFQHHHSNHSTRPKATLWALLRRLRRLMMNSSIRNLAMKNWFIWKLPICSMYGIFTNIYPINHPNVGKYTIHGAYGIYYHVGATGYPWNRRCPESALGLAQDVLQRKRSEARFGISLPGPKLTWDVWDRPGRK